MKSVQNLCVHVHECVIDWVRGYYSSCFSPLTSCCPDRTSSVHRYLIFTRAFFENNVYKLKVVYNSCFEHLKTQLSVNNFWQRLNDKFRWWKPIFWPYWIVIVTIATVFQLLVDGILDQHLYTILDQAGSGRSPNSTASPRLVVFSW
jgi:hypothetical protein